MKKGLGLDPRVGTTAGTGEWLGSWDKPHAPEPLLDRAGESL